MRKIQIGETPYDGQSTVVDSDDELPWFTGKITG